MMFLALLSNFSVDLNETVALAAVATIGYLVGRRKRRVLPEQNTGELHQELSRATHIAKEMQQIASRIRQDVASHQSNIARFKTRVLSMNQTEGDDGWQSLGAEAETLLVPTMKLATDLANAYDQLRKQSLLLMNFAGSRTDPETGIHNRRAMEEQLEVLFSLHGQDNNRFALSLFSLDCSDETRALGDHLRSFATILESCARDTDVVARYSPDEFVVLMPQTTLSGATIFSERLLRRVESEMNAIVAGGVVEVQQDDDMQKILSRADSALYSARADGTNCLYRHNGETIILLPRDLSTTSPVDEANRSHATAEA